MGLLLFFGVMALIFGGQFAIAGAVATFVAYIVITGLELRDGSAIVTTLLTIPTVTAMTLSVMG